MNHGRDQGRATLREIVAGATAVPDVDLAIMPPFPMLGDLAEISHQSAVALGAQNMHWEPSGAFTGEVHGALLRDFGCEFVILGHSERRALFGETDEMVRAKVLSAIDLQLKPVVCVGETLTQRDEGRTLDVVRAQFLAALGGHDEAAMQEMVIAYEPVWAIGTGKVATPEQAEQVHADLREMLKTEYNPKISDTIRILYGGSVKPDNAAELLGQANIDGALVGGASLQAASFLAIASSAVVA